MKVEEVKKSDGSIGLIKHWTEGVQVDVNTMNQARDLASMPFIHKHIALMPDCHLGKGATIGSVISTKKAIIPAATGVDLGCGMVAAKLNFKSDDLPESLYELRSKIENSIPLGKNHHSDYTKEMTNRWGKLDEGYDELISKHKKIGGKDPIYQMGTLGGGNHFIEICLDENNNVWVMLHSGSRNIGNRIGSYFIDLARKEMETHFIKLPDKDLAYLCYGTKSFNDYWSAVSWAQQFAFDNREVMLLSVMKSIKSIIPHAMIMDKQINCHHNYVSLENHFGENVYVTRKGAIRAREGDYGIIPGSMGTRSYIVKGKGNPQSFCSCSHGAGRVMSRSKAKLNISIDDHLKSTDGVECRKDIGVLDESPLAYKDIDAVMEAQKDLVEPVYTLKQILCVKG